MKLNLISAIFAICLNGVYSKPRKSLIPDIRIDPDNPINPGKLIDVGDCPSTMPYPTAYHGTGNGGYYIGFIQNTCTADHTYVCKRYAWSMSRIADGPIFNEGHSTHCVPEYSECYNSKGDQRRIYIYDKGIFKNPFNDSHCNKSIKVVVNSSDRNCYYSATTNKVLVSGLKERIVDTMVNNDGQTPRMINGRCLVGAGWCQCKKYVPPSPKPAPVSKNTYNCKGGKSYCIDRCYRKLKDKTWRYSNKKAQIGNTEIKNIYCQTDACQAAFDDFNGTRNSRSSYWRNCKNIITNDFKIYWGFPYTIDDSSIDW
jgi:hypothetical protein